MRAGMLHRLIEVLSGALKRCGSEEDLQAVERIAVMVNRVMSYQSRQFHTLDHVFGFLDGADSETAIAAIFHDLIYFQVDDGLPEEVASLLSPYLDQQGQTIRIGTSVHMDDRAFSDTLAIFGFSPGQELLPFSGLNEFLSALVAAKILESLIPYRSVIEIVVAIEATIPFRRPDKEGRGVGEALLSRLISMAPASKGSIDEERAHAAVSRAIAFANHDVRDFALEDPGEFLSNTWRLLPESNASLRRKGSFSIREYRIALQKMLGFFKSLSPDFIFHQFGDWPANEVLMTMRERAKHNLDLARQYLQAKLLAAGILEAIAVLSGGDAPMALFMGEIPPEGGDYKGLVDILPPADRPAWIDGNNAVYRLLRDGRLDDSSFDLKNSPLALYLYNRLTPALWRQGTAAMDDFFAGSVDASSILAILGPSLLKDLAIACATIVPWRAQALLGLPEEGRLSNLA